MATVAQINAAWHAFRQGRKGPQYALGVGPGPGFREAIDAALALSPIESAEYKSAELIPNTVLGENIADGERLAFAVDFGEPVALVYTNWRGETSTRRVLPKAMYFGSNKWHTTRQWIVIALDVEKGEEREFALAGFKGPPGMVCAGCGSTQTVAEIRATHPSALSCCPERNMQDPARALIRKLADHINGALGASDREGSDSHELWAEAIAFLRPAISPAPHTMSGADALAMREPASEPAPASDDDRAEQWLTVRVLASGDHENTAAEAVNLALQAAVRAGHSITWSEPAPASAPFEWVTVPRDEPTPAMMAAVDCAGEKRNWPSGRAWRAGYQAMMATASERAPDTHNRALRNALKDILRSCRKDFPNDPEGERNFKAAYAEQFAALAAATDRDT